MVTTARDVKSAAKDYVDLLQGDIHVNAVYQWTHYGDGLDFIVISNGFEGLDEPGRNAILARASSRMSPSVQAWGFTQAELSGERPSLLEMMMTEARQVYPSPAAKPARKAKASHVN